MAYPDLLVVSEGELSGKRYAVTPLGLRLGRSSANDIHIPDGGLSRIHCLFERLSSTEQIRVTDLASANGTFVNGRNIGTEPTVLKTGDVIEVGMLRLKVGGATAAPSAAVDLGLATKAESPSAPALEAAPHAPLSRRTFYIAVLLVVAVAVAAMVLFVRPADEKPTMRAVEIPAAASAAPAVREMYYEKVDADSEGIFRFALRLSDAGLLTVSLDDSQDGGRHVTKSVTLAPSARKALGEILGDSAFRTLDDEYAGAESEPPVLHSLVLHVVYGNGEKSVSSVNATPPALLRTLAEKIETFVKNEIGAWAMGYSRRQLVDLAAASAAAGQVKWEDRDVEYGNVHAAIKAYREALFYLDTVDPKPPEEATYRVALKTAEEELDARYRNQRFVADRAINLQDWETAQRELKILCALVPDREDDRCREATAKLVDAERRLEAKGVRQ